MTQMPILKVSNFRLKGAKAEMKFYIDDNEIKTVNANATIRGCLSLISRSAKFSFIYNENDSNFIKYKAKINSTVKIKNDNNKSIFSGFITRINYMADKKLVEIEANDYFTILLNEKVTGRFAGKIFNAVNNLLSGLKIYSNLQNIKTAVENKLNVVSLGNLSRYDILEIFIKNLYATEEFKLYIDGDSSLNVLLPFRDNSRGDFILGENVISAFFSKDDSLNNAFIVAIGDDNIVSGCVIRLIDKINNKKGYFTVKSDVHTYGNTHTMELELKERI